MFHKFAENQYILQRIDKGEELRSMGINPYDNANQRNITNSDFISKFSYVNELENRRDEQAIHVIAGRIKFAREMGKASFIKLDDDTGTLQSYISVNDIGVENFSIFKKYMEVGDIVEVEGYPFVTKTGELSLHAKRIKLLTKAICPLPEKYHGLTDVESRYRQRYVDLIMNHDVKEIFRLRSKIVSQVRRFFENKGFLEVETPMMHPIAGGANARPFITHHNALDVERYLRIAPELYLKRLVVGGFEAVFEINRNFRNEGMDHTHNPEFTMIEFYWAYKTYKDLMSLTEELFDSLFSHLNLPQTLTFDDVDVNFTTPFRKISYKDSIIQIGKVPVDVLATLENIKIFLSQHEIEFNPHINYGEGLAELFDNFVEKKLINPTFVTDFPVEISPLARRSDENPEITERFELFIAGREIANGFSELNDPIDQYERFKGQVEAKAKGNDEACDMDEDYVNALGYGLPPTAGQGIGIDRLVMLLTGQTSIKDVILFPAMKPQHD